tara:strand:+ start:42 stop:1712 length:1671 start_codon:yes stop_codon:yes gene_type:complete
MGTFWIDEQGAVADDGLCDLSAVNQAIDAAIEYGPGSTVVFGNGVYDFNCFGTENEVIRLDRKDGITISGVDSTVIVIHDLEKSFIKLVLSDDISIDGFTVRWTPVPFTQGKVVAKNEGLNAVLVAPLPDFAAFDSDLFNGVKVTANFTNPVARQRIKDSTLQDYSVTERRVENNGPNYWVNLGENIGANVDIDDGFILRTRTSAHVVELFKCKNPTIKNVIVNAAPGILIAGSHNENVTIDNLDTKRYGLQWTSGNADAINLGGTRGPVTIKNCDLDALGDDFINLHGRRMMVEGIIDSSIIKVSANQFQVQPGDELILFRPSNGATSGTGVVKSVTYFDSRKKSWLVEFNSAINYQFQEGDYSYNESRMSNGFSITNNRFWNGRRGGVVVRGNDGLISGNEFKGLGGNCITTDSGLSHIEGYRLKGTLIDNNVFRDCALSTMNTHASIYITTPKLSGGVAVSKVNENNTISNNTIISYQGNAVKLEAAKSIEISNNILKTLTTNFIYRPNYIFHLINVNAVDITNNDASGDFRAHDGHINAVQGIYNVNDNVWP